MTTDTRSFPFRRIVFARSARHDGEQEADFGPTRSRSGNRANPVTVCTVGPIEARSRNLTASNREPVTSTQDLNALCLATTPQDEKIDDELGQTRRLKGRAGDLPPGWAWNDSGPSE